MPVDDISESIIVEELARVDPSFSVMFCVHVGLCAKTIALHGDDYQKETYLSRLAEGEVGAYSLSEAGAGTDAAAMTCKAKLSDDGTHYILNGEKMWVTNGAQAKIIVLFAKDVDHPDYGVKRHGGTTAFIVDSSFEGFSVGKKEDKLGIRSSDTCTLVLKDCKVPVENIIKGAGNGFPIAMNALDNSRIGIAAQALGIAQGAYEASLKYAHEREAISQSPKQSCNIHVSSIEKTLMGQGPMKNGMTVIGTLSENRDIEVELQLPFEANEQVQAFQSNHSIEVVAQIIDWNVGRKRAVFTANEFNYS